MGKQREGFVKYHKKRKTMKGGIFRGTNKQR